MNSSGLICKTFLTSCKWWLVTYANLLHMKVALCLMLNASQKRQFQGIKWMHIVLKSFLFLKVRPLLEIEIHNFPYFALCGAKKQLIRFDYQLCNFKLSLNLRVFAGSWIVCLSVGGKIVFARANRPLPQHTF